MIVYSSQLLMLPYFLPKENLKKKSRLEQEFNLWPLLTGAVLYQLSYLANWELAIWYSR